MFNLRYKQKLNLESEGEINQEDEQEAKLKALESQAIRYELVGDLYNARKTWYEIKRIDPKFQELT